MISVTNFLTTADIEIEIVKSLVQFLLSRELQSELKRDGKVSVACQLNKKKWLKTHPFKYSLYFYKSNGLL